MVLMPVAGFNTLSKSLKKYRWQKFIGSTTVRGVAAAFLYHGKSFTRQLPENGKRLKIFHLTEMKKIS